MKKHAKSVSLYMIMIVMIILVLIVAKMLGGEVQQAAYNQNNLLADLMAENTPIAALELKRDPDISNAGTALIEFKDKSQRVLPVINMDNMTVLATDAAMRNPGMIYREALPEKTGLIIASLLPIVMIIISILVLFFLFQQMNGGGNKVMSFGKSKAKAVVDDKKKITFDNVAGLDEEKGELRELVDFLKAPKKYVDIGARIPKGVLLVGPPGTGKTLLAKAVAGEAGVPFFSVSGSDFVEMFVGVGASRVRDLFENAKKNSPCIAFIDEIDAVGRRRGAGLGGGHDEREQTLNQLLVEMDGFGVNEGVIVLAATNRADILDPALLRPGRFDRRVAVNAPDVKGREEILQVHSKNKKLGEDVDLHIIALSTAGMTGADLENLMNEAAILAARDNHKEITMEYLRRAFIKVGIGTEKKSRVVSDKEKRMVAYHEAGHAVLDEMLPAIDPVHIVSIIPTGSAGGYTMHIPAEDNSYASKTRMEQTIIAFLGGRAAEKIFIGDITVGASSDISRATDIARGMVTRFGMSELLGPIQFGDSNDEVFIGRDFAHTKNYGEETASAIDREINRIITHAYSEAERILNENADVMHATVTLLLEKEKITGDEFRALFTRPLPKKDFVITKSLIDFDKKQDDAAAPETESETESETEPEA